MTHPVPVRLSGEELALLDDLVAAGLGSTRSAVMRRAMRHLSETVSRARTGTAIADSYRDLPQTADDDAVALANAIAMTQAEPW